MPFSPYRHLHLNIYCIRWTHFFYHLSNSMKHNSRGRYFYTSSTSWVIIKKRWRRFRRFFEKTNTQKIQRWSFFPFFNWYVEQTISDNYCFIIRTGMYLKTQRYFVFIIRNTFELNINSLSYYYKIFYSHSQIRG